MIPIAKPMMGEAEAEAARLESDYPKEVLNALVKTGGLVADASARPATIA